MGYPREQIIDELERQFTPFTNTLLTALRKARFYFDEQSTAHLDGLNESLVIRHSLPFCITENTFFETGDDGVPFFSAVVLLHSLALTRMDDYYDGGSLTKKPNDLNIEALAYALSATHKGTIELIRMSPNAAELLKLLNITNFIHSRMYKDYTERYKNIYLESPEQRINHYLYSKYSRLMGSGYWEVMARAAFVRRGMRFPDFLHRIDLNLRKFRQIIDELADLHEDLKGGLVTLPILHALLYHPESNKLRAEIIDHWSSGAKPDIEKYITEAKTKKWIYDQAMTYYENGMNELEDKLQERGDGFRKLFDFKKAKLDTLVS